MCVSVDVTCTYSHMCMNVDATHSHARMYGFMCMHVCYMPVHVGALCVYVHGQVRVSSKGMATGEHRSAMYLFISVSQSRNPTVIALTTDGQWTAASGSAPIPEVERGGGSALGGEGLRVGAGGREPWHGLEQSD